MLLVDSLSQGVNQSTPPFVWAVLVFFNQNFDIFLRLGDNLDWVTINCLHRIPKVRIKLG